MQRAALLIVRVCSTAALCAGGWHLVVTHDYAHAAADFGLAIILRLHASDGEDGAGG